MPLLDRCLVSHEIGALVHKIFRDGRLRVGLESICDALTPRRKRAQAPTGVAHAPLPHARRRPHASSEPAPVRQGAACGSTCCGKPRARGTAKATHRAVPRPRRGTRRTTHTAAPSGPRHAAALAHLGERSALARLGTSPTRISNPGTPSLPSGPRGAALLCAVSLIGITRRARKRTWPFKGWQRLAAGACDERTFEMHFS